MATDEKTTTSAQYFAHGETDFPFVWDSKVKSMNGSKYENRNIYIDDADISLLQTKVPELTSRKKIIAWIFEQANIDLNNVRTLEVKEKAGRKKTKAFADMSPIERQEAIQKMSVENLQENLWAQILPMVKSGLKAKDIKQSFVDTYGLSKDQANSAFSGELCDVMTTEDVQQLVLPTAETQEDINA